MSEEINARTPITDLADRVGGLLKELVVSHPQRPFVDSEIANIAIWSNPWHVSNVWNYLINGAPILLLPRNHSRQRYTPPSSCPEVLKTWGSHWDEWRVHHLCYFEILIFSTMVKRKVYCEAIIKKLSCWLRTLSPGRSYYRSATMLLLSRNLFPVFQAECCLCSLGAENCCWVWQQKVLAESDLGIRVQNLETSVLAVSEFEKNCSDSW